MFFSPSLTFLDELATDGDSESSEASDTPPTNQHAQGSFLNLLPPQLEVSEELNDS